MGGFDKLEVALSITPSIALPDFSQTFEVETDACATGIWISIAFIVRAFGPKHQGLFVYEKELLVVVYALQKWGTY